MTPDPWTAAAGTDWTTTLTILAADGTAVDLAGASLEWRWDALPAAEDARVYTDAGRIRLGAATGEIELELSPTDTRELYGEVWTTAVVVDFGDGRRREYIRRAFQIRREIAQGETGS